MTTQVRVATETDHSTLALLRSAWTAEVHGEVEDAGFAPRFTSWMDAERERRTFWVAHRAERPVGMVNLLVVDRMPRPHLPAGRWGYLGSLFVVPDHRRSGVGTLLVTAVLAEAGGRGLERVITHPNVRSLPFWRRSSFEKASDLLVVQLA